MPIVTRTNNYFKLGRGRELIFFDDRSVQSTSEAYGLAELRRREETVRGHVRRERISVFREPLVGGIWLNLHVVGGVSEAS